MTSRIRRRISFRLMPMLATSSGIAAFSYEVDLRQSGTDDVHMRWLMVGGIDDEPEAVRPMDNDHPSI